MTIENGPFVTSVKIGLKAKTKKGQDAVTSSYKIFFLVNNEIIYLMQITGLVGIFYSYKYFNFTFVQVIMHHSLFTSFLASISETKFLTSEQFLQNPNARNKLL